MNLATTDHALVGQRLRVTYRPRTQDLKAGRLSFGDPETVEFEVTRANDVHATGQADDGRMVSTPLTRGGNNTVRARSADRDQGAFRSTLGSLQSAEVVSR